MTYSDNYPIRPVGGRLALDFVNTADWTNTDTIVHEKIKTHGDLTVWMAALDIETALPPESIAELHELRSNFRKLFLGNGTTSGLMNVLKIDLPRSQALGGALSGQPLEALLAISALSILIDGRELARVKRCPGDKCGWLFIDETKNSRRRWCSMQLCGNRAKASRHYRRSKL